MNPNNLDRFVPAPSLLPFYKDTTLEDSILSISQWNPICCITIGEKCIQIVNNIEEVSISVYRLHIQDKFTYTYLLTFAENPKSMGGLRTATTLDIKHSSGHVIAAGFSVLFSSQVFLCSHLPPKSGRLSFKRSVIPFIDCWSN